MLPMIPYQPRRPAPWQAFDLFFIVLFWLFAWNAADLVLGSVAPCTPADCGGNGVDASHVLVQIMWKAGPWTLLLCGLSAIVVAPIFEEFFFRVLLQGWFESVERRGRWQFPGLRRFMPPGFWSILLPTVLFASMHFRVASPAIDANVLVRRLIVAMGANVLTVAFAVGWLRWRVGAAAADFGWSPQKFFADFALGLAVFAIIALPIYGLQVTLGEVLPKNLAPDPFTLFFFSLVLGFLYYRTHRIAPSLAVHAALNAASTIVILAMK